MPLPNAAAPSGLTRRAEQTSSALGVLTRAFRRAAVIVIAWAGAAVFFAWQEYDLAARRGEPDRFTLRLIEAASPMLLWALLTPLLLYLNHLFPIRKPHRGRNLLVVVAIATLVAVARASADVMLMVTRHGTAASVVTLAHTHLIFGLIIIAVANFIRLEQEEQTRRHTLVRSETETAEAVLRQLRADLNPHFLFNTLNAVATLLHAQPRAAERMLEKLSDFLGNVVATEHAREVRLSDELELVSRYFDLQTMRFGGKLTTRIEVADPALRAAAIPPLLLQPLIENAIIHGVMRRRDGGCVAVRVDSYRDMSREWLRIDIADNGPGFVPATAGDKARVGLTNVTTRLESMYGTAQALTYFHTRDEFVARLLIPLNLVPR